MGLQGSRCLEISSTKILSATGELSRNAEPWALTQTHCSRTCILARAPSDLYMLENLRSKIMAVSWNHVDLLLFFFTVLGGWDCKEYSYNAGDPDSIPGMGRSPGGGHDNPLQYSCLENPMDRGTWQATVHGVTESDMTEWLTHTQFSFNLEKCFICSVLKI